MYTKRIIPCLDIKDGKTVKGINFKGLQNIGDPVEMAMEYCSQMADELVFLDISATLEGRKTFVSLVEKIAEKVGLAFQVQDDILDVTASEELLGKPLHSDEKNGKQTYVALVGLDGAREVVARLSKEAVEAFDTLPYENAFLRELLLSLITREH